MKLLLTIKAGFNGWIDAVAGVIGTLHDRYNPPRVIQLIEDENGQFEAKFNAQTVAERSTSERVRISEAQIVAGDWNSLSAPLLGSRVELILQSRRFLFSPLDLPSRAAEFLDGIVRTQIDRLTPWGASDAAFGWSKPAQAGTDRIVVTIAATARALVARYAQPIAVAGAHSVAVFAALPLSGDEAPPVKVLEDRARGTFDIGGIRRALIVLLVAAAFAGTVATGISGIVCAGLDVRQDELARQIARARAAAASRDFALGSSASAMRTLEARKHDDPSSLIVLETLSRILPDHTYVTELRIEANKLRLVGVTRDAPSLIGLIEQSVRFTRATFFAPTTRSSSEQGERFHIEAQLQPLAPSKP